MRSNKLSLKIRSMAFSNVELKIITVLLAMLILIVYVNCGAVEPYRSQDCCAIQLEGHTKSGVYKIYPFENDTRIGIQVYCDLKTDGGGWTVLQKREEVTGPMERFYRGWESYVNGFGSLNYSHWLGLDNMAAITGGMDQELRIDLVDWRGKSLYSSYKEFYVNDKWTFYRLHIRNHNGTTADHFAPHSNGVAFSTKDRDHDNDVRNCAAARNAAWWYITCDGPNLNGLYIMNGTRHTDGLNGISWGQVKAFRYALKRVEMKVRNRNFPHGCLGVGARIEKDEVDEGDLE